MQMGDLGYPFARSHGYRGAGGPAVVVLCRLRGLALRERCQRLGSDRGCRYRLPARRPDRGRSRLDRSPVRGRTPCPLGLGVVRRRHGDAGAGRRRLVLDRGDPARTALPERRRRRLHRVLPPPVRRRLAARRAPTRSRSPVSGARPCDRGNRHLHPRVVPVARSDHSRQGERAAADAGDWLSGRRRSSAHGHRGAASTSATVAPDEIADLADRRPRFVGRGGHHVDEPVARRRLRRRRLA